MPKQKVKVGQEVKNKCPVCGEGTQIRFRGNFTLTELRNDKKLECECHWCDTEFWFYPRIGKITVKKIDKTYVD